MLVVNVQRDGRDFSTDVHDCYGEITAAVSVEIEIKYRHSTLLRNIAVHGIRAYVHGRASTYTMHASGKRIR